MRWLTMWLVAGGCKAGDAAGGCEQYGEQYGDSGLFGSMSCRDTTSEECDTTVPEASFTPSTSCADLGYGPDGLPQ